MKPKPVPSPSVQTFLHPYIFVLKEGMDIQGDCLDYSLMILYVGLSDVLRSPKNTSSNLNIQLLKK